MRKGLDSILLLLSLYTLALCPEVKGGQVVDVSLGDFEDAVYTVLLSIGSTTVPLLLDTGSSDTWLVSTSSSLSNATLANPFNVSLYDPIKSTSFQSITAEAKLYYGDASTRTHAFGIVGRENVEIAPSPAYDATTKNTTTKPKEGVGGGGNLTIPNQLFAAMSDTDTHVLELGAAGIMGLGFAGQSELARLMGSAGPDSTLPFIARLASSGFLARQMFSLALQRAAKHWPDSHKLERGILTLGGLLPSIKDNTEMVWVNVSMYRDAETGVFAPKRWEIPIDGVFLDGVRLDSKPVTALIDSGSSLIRGPPLIVQEILSAIIPPSPSSSNASINATSTTTASSPSPPNTFPCASPHILSFLIAGTLFPIDPRDFASPYYMGKRDVCVGNVVGLDRGGSAITRRTSVRNGGGGPVSRGGGAGSRGVGIGSERMTGTKEDLRRFRRRKRVFVSAEAETGYEWSLGAPFLRSVLASFHYGNLTHPSSNPPRIGLRSTVPSDAGARMIALNSGGGLQGQPQAAGPATNEGSSSEGKQGSVRPRWDFGKIAAGPPVRWVGYGQGTGNEGDQVVYEPPRGIVGVRQA